MNPNRILKLKKSDEINKSSSYVLYWMQQSQRVHYNHALDYAIETANQNKLPLLVIFGMTPNYPEANRRHYQFMLEGLCEVSNMLKKLGIHFIIKVGQLPDVLYPYLKDAHALIMDYGHLKTPRKWRLDILEHAQNKHPHLSIDMVESDLIVPAYIASQKVEYGAYTIRAKLHRQLPFYRDFTKLKILDIVSKLNISSDIDLNHIHPFLDQLPIDQSVFPSSYYKGGLNQAMKLFNDFLTSKADNYLKSNDPSTSFTSLMSMYLHFGQISSLMLLDQMVLAQAQNHISSEVYDAYIEQLFIRRELAFNFTLYQKNYDQFDQMTEPWAYQTMKIHTKDERQYIYSMSDYETFNTHDPYFNAAMKQMVYTGYMHNYMRMYWAKKILEWSKTHKEAYETTIYLNNKYFIDGRDANSYTGVAWVYGKHDRAWTERAVFGKLRYMNSEGLKRKFDIETYVHQMDYIEREHLNKL